MNLQPDLIVVLDLGKSRLKIIYQIPREGKVKALFIEPGIAELSPEEVGHLQPSRTAAPEDDAWLMLPSTQPLAVGFLAETRFAPRCDTKEAKYKIVSGAVRYLTAIGAIAQREKEALMEYKGFASKGTDNAAKYLRIHATLLLPHVEMPNASSLRSELAGVAPKPIQFNFRGQDYTHLTVPDYFKLNILAEGAGQLALRGTQLSEAEFARKNILVLVMGQYNVTAMLYQRGQCVKIESPALGFHNLVNYVLDKTALDASIIRRAQLTEAIYYGRDDRSLLQALLIGKVEKEEHIQQLTEEMVRAVEDGFKSYWNSTANWLKTMLGPNLVTLDEVLVGGGASVAFKEEIEKLFGNAKVIWGGGIKREIAQTFGLKLSDPMVNRLVDAYGVFKRVSQMYNSSVDKVTV
ncbi:MULTISPECIES: hypothetical protein [Aerosakkonema]|uniref:hypothetical protein n=1 Tax=Aerosakkonema TaxID=1246629 RepID=UPI0035B992C9